MASSSETSDVRPLPLLMAGFDGNFASLPRENPVDCRFLPPAYLTCEDGSKLYVASVRPGVVGGSRSGGVHVSEETLLVQLLDGGSLDAYPAAKYKKNGVSPARFFWLPKGSNVLRVAPLAWRGDTQHSLRVKSYEADGTRCYLQLHNLLGWTFLCQPRLAPHRWSDLWEFDHDDVDHGNNRFANLVCKPTSKHRARSGAQGSAVKRQRAG